jgi:hypothetical protein
MNRPFGTARRSEAASIPGAATTVQTMVKNQESAYRQTLSTQKNQQTPLHFSELLD